MNETVTQTAENVTNFGMMATKGVLSVVGLFTIISAIAGVILVRRKI